MSICPKCGKPICGSVGTFEDRGNPPGLQGTKYGIPEDYSTWSNEPHVSTNTLEIRDPWVPDPRFLKHRLTLDDLRREQGKRGEVGDLRIVDFVLLHKPGDQVWYWDNMYDLAGSAGYVLVRNGRVIAMFTTMVS